MTLPLAMTTLSPPVSTQSGKTLYVIVGVGGAVMVLIAAGVIVITVTVGLKKKKSKQHTVTYGVSESEMELSTNTEFIAAHDNSGVQGTAHMYDYVTDTNITAPNKAYEKTSDIPVSSNQAYGIVEHYYDYPYNEC